MELDDGRTRFDGRSVTLVLKKGGLFSGSADQIVSPDHVRDLWRHWECCPIEWYQGAHVSFRAHREVDAFVRRALHESGLTALR